ncbi:HAMP domain-containing protein [Alicyclobacillus vulcanalis]|uniref:HAMP domain-containing protein n=1 Tax=Alicyclobacillus vulcanalis TaxID=252246 RepID=A0A1N7K8H7_9BACL|nr:HAMP domain-containing protein [Alicyclobacillus vulcanalis]
MIAIRRLGRSLTVWIWMVTWVLMMSCLVILGSFVMRKLRAISEEVGRRSLVTFVVQTADYLNEQFLSVERTALRTLVSDPVIQCEIDFREPPKGYTPYTMYTYVNRLLTQVQRNHDELIDTVMLLLDNGMEFVDEGHQLAPYRPIDQPYQWFVQHTFFNTTPVWIGEQPPAEWLFDDHRPRFFVSQWLPTTPSDAIVVIGIKPEYVRTVMESVSTGRDADLAVLDEHGHWLTGLAPPSDLSKPLERVVSRAAADGIATTPSGSLVVAVASIPLNGWKVVSWIPSASLTEGADDHLRGWMFAALAWGSMASLFIAFIFSRMVARPLNRLTEAMSLVEQGDLSVRLDTRLGWYEFQVLAQGFDRLVSEIHRLLEQTKLQEEEKRQLEFAALQAQINPHFLYNTLDSIYWMAYAREEREIEQLVYALGRFLRLSLSDPRAFLTLSEELEHVQRYVEIQNIRFQGRIRVELVADPSVLQVHVPKFTLQPLVENSILHGFAERSEGRITIRAHRQDAGYVVIEVEDDGRPPSAESKADPQRERTGLGIKNLVRRLQLYFGPEFSFDMRTTAFGTCVRLRLPVSSGGLSHRSPDGNGGDWNASARPRM